MCNFLTLMGLSDDALNDATLPLAKALDVVLSKSTAFSRQWWHHRRAFFVFIYFPFGHSDMNNHHEYMEDCLKFQVPMDTFHKSEVGLRAIQEAIRGSVSTFLTKDTRRGNLSHCTGRLTPSRRKLTRFWTFRSATVIWNG